MARTYEEMMARMDELEKAQAATTAAPAQAPPVARVPAAPKPAVAPGMEALPKPSAAPPAPTVTRRAVSVTPKVEEIKAPKPPEVEAPKLVGLTPDLAKPVDYKKFYDYSRTIDAEGAIAPAAADLGMSSVELKRIAQAQGVDLEAIFKARQKGRTYDEIAKAGRERGVIGFMPVAEREQAFNKLAQDVEKAQRGDAGDTIELVRSGADKGFGPAGALGGYTFAGTQAELPEVAKPGEHGYAVAQILVEALQKDPSAVRAYDLYGRSLATGNTQRYIDDRVEDLRKRANVKVTDADAMEKMAALRKRAINEVIAYKTVGQWTPVVTLGDVEVREGRASPGALAALKPNIEIIGFNNKRQAIFRQESPMGVLFRAIDVPQAAIAGVLSGQTVGQGIQSGANLLEYSLDATKDSAMYVKAPVVAAGFAASILFPDALVAAGAAGKAVKAVSKIRAARKIAPEATALLETIVRTRKAGDYEAAAAAEKQLRSLLPDVASNLDSADAAVARFQKLAEPESDILDTDLAALIAGAAPEQARVVAGRPFLHPSLRKFVVGPSGLEQADYAELFDTRRQLDRVQRAKAEYIKARTTGRSVTDYTKDYVRGRVHDVFENLPAERQLSLTQVNRMADLISAQAPAALLDQKQFKKAVEDALKADAEFGTDAYKMARQDAYKAIGGRTETKLDEIRGKTIEELEAADMGLFDRAIKAIEQNNTARGVAAQLLRDEIAGAARLRVEPLELFDEVAPKLSSGEPIRLTPGGLLLLHHLRQAYPKQDFKEAYATITIIDKMIEGAAQAREVSPLALYQEIFPLIKRGTPEDLKRLAGDLKAGKVPTGGAPTGGAPAAPTKAARARAEAKLREMMRRLGDEELDEIEGMLRADGVQEGEAYALDAIKREKQRRVSEAKKVVSAAPVPMAAATPPTPAPAPAAVAAEALAPSRTVQPEAAQRARPAAPTARPSATPSARIIAAAKSPELRRLAETLQGTYDAKGRISNVRTSLGDLGFSVRWSPQMGNYWTPSFSVMQSQPEVPSWRSSWTNGKIPSNLTHDPVTGRNFQSGEEALAHALKTFGEIIDQRLKDGEPPFGAGIAEEVMPVSDEERVAQLQAELEQAIQSGDEFRQGELEMEIENLRRTAQPEAAPAPVAVEEVVEAPVAAPTVEAPAPTIAEPPTPAPIAAAAEVQPEATIIPREVAQKLDEAKIAAPPPPPTPKGYSVMPNKGNNYEVPWTAYLSGKDSPDIRKVASTRDDLGMLITPYTSSYVKQAGAYPFFAVDNGVFAAKGFDPQKFEKLIGEVAALPEATRNKLLFVVAPDVLIKNPDGTVFGDAKGTLELFKQWGPKIRAKGLPVALVAQNGLEDMVDDIPWDDFDVLFIGGSTEWKIGDFSYIADPAARRATQDKWTKLFQAVYDNGKPIHMGRVSGPERLMRGGTEMGAATVDGTMLAVAPDQMMGKLIRMLDDLNVKGRVQLADQLYPDTGAIPGAEDFIALAQDPRIDVSDLDAFYRTVEAVAPGLVVNDTAPGLVKVAKAEKRRVYEEVQRLRKEMAPPTQAKRKRASRRGPAPGGKTWIEFFRQAVKPEKPSDALRAVAQRVLAATDDPDYARSYATREATARLTGKTPEQILDAPPTEREALLQRLDVDGGVTEDDLVMHAAPSMFVDVTQKEALELGGFPKGTKPEDITPEVLDSLIDRVAEIAAQVGGGEALEPRLREMGGGSVESLADVRYNAKDLQDRIVPMNVDQAFDFVRKVHSKLPDPRPQGLLEAYGVAAGGDVRVVGLLNTPSGPFADADGVVELSRVASDGKLKNGSSAVTYWAMQNLQRYNRSGDPAKARLVTTSLLTEPGEVYKALDGILVQAGVSVDDIERAAAEGRIVVLVKDREQARAIKQMTVKSGEEYKAVDGVRVPSSATPDDIENAVQNGDILVETDALHPTSLVTPSEGTGSRAGAKGTAQKGEWKINWEFGPAAAPEAPHLYHLQPVYRDVVMNGEKLSVKRLNSLVQRPGTDLVDAYKDAARVLGVSSDEPAMLAAEGVSNASPAGRRLLAEDLRYMLLEKFNSKAVADADRKEQAKLLNKALKAEAPVAAEPLTPAAVEEATTSTPQVEAALISTETTPSRIQMAAKQTNVRNPELVAMAKAVREGKATREQYDALVNRLRPITPYKQLPAPTPETQMQSALKSNQKRKIGAPRQVAEGTPVGLRVDIPALQDHGAWVVTVHEKRKSKSPRSLAGSVIGYDNVATIRNAEFVVPGENSILIASGVDNKMPYATIEGAWVPMTTEQAVARAQAAFNDPAWVQVGQDPLRHAYFYDRTTTQPIVGAEEVIQIGPLVLAKNPTYAPKEKFLYSIEPLARTAPSPWAEVPQRFVVAAETRLRKAAEDLDAGRINVVDYDVRVGDVRKDLTAQKAARDARKAEAPLVRGASEVRAKLLRAQAAGVIDEAGVDLADWLIRQNPRIADDLNVAILAPESAKKRFGVDVGEAVGGFYEPLDRIVALIKERGSEETAVHEILHHTERMLPEALQTAVRDEWAKQLTAALRRATPEQRPLLEKALTGQSSALLQGVGDGTLPRAFYQFSNPSEFWAVNASRIVSGRYAALDKGLIARAKQWLTEFVQKVKSAFKLPSDAPLIRGLDAVLKGEGTFVSKQMLSEGGVFRSTDGLESVRTPEFNRWFRQSTLVAEDGEPLVLFHGTQAKGIQEFRESADGALGPGVYVTQSFDAANAYAGEGGRVEMLYARAERPLVIYTDGGDTALQIARDPKFEEENFFTAGAARRWAREQMDEWAGIGDEDFPQMLRDAGYDSVILKDRATGEIVEAVLPSRMQVKSIRNKGEFDPASANIYASVETQAPMPSGISSTPLRQVSPTGEVKGAVEWLEDGSSVIYLFEGADASTVLHEVAHVVRRNILSNEDMGFIASWVQGLGVNVGHQYGEFTGDAAEIEKAEELFAKAFEQYVAEGKAPAGLEGAFAQLKDAVANIYKAVKDPVIGVELQPEVRRVFDGLFATEPKQADQSLKEAIRRGILGGPEAEVDILTVLSREAKRKGLDQFSPDELATRINEAKANIKQIAKRDPTGTDVVLKFETKVLGKDKWTINDLAAAQAARDARLAPQAEARMALLRDMTGKGRGKAAIYKQDTAVESLWTALSSKETDAPMTKQAKKALRGVASLYFGGNVLEETKMAGQPPAFRRALDTSARIVEQSLADTVALVNDAVATGDDTQLLRYLTGDSDVAKVSGRPILSSGHDKMGAVNRMIQRAIAAFKDDEKEALIELADAINTKDPVERGQKLVTLGFTASGGEVSFKEADEARKAMSDALRRAVGKLLYPEKKDADIGTALASAIRDSVNAPDKARPSHELRLVETLTYIGGVTARDGDLFKGDSKDVVRALLGDIRKIYGEIGEESARRVAVQIGAFGGADQAKQFLVRMGLGVDEKTQAAFARFLNGEQPGAENIAGVDRMLNTFGRDIQFVPDAALDVDFYIPRAARERMAQVLSRAQFRTEESVGAADALATSYRYMKTRMTRGNFFIRQRYFMMNTVDHFNAMAYTAGFGIAAASTARVIAQDLLVVPLMREILEVGKAAGVLSPVATERLRSSLQKLGDRAAGRIGKMMSVSKYRIEVNPILEGVDGGFTVGGKVYRYRDIRDIAVEEGVFSSFDTRELQRAILREGQLVLGDAAAQKAVVRSPTRLAWMRNGLASLEESVSDIAEAWGERERLGAMVTLMEAGYDPRAAAQITVKALFDYSQSMTKLDRLWLVNLLLPFWAFQKNANQQVFNMLFSPWGGYRMMVVKRARERTSDLLGNIMYNTLVDDYGVDVESMPPELQDSYYATIKAFEEAFGPDGPPPEAKRAMRMLLSGRAIDVEDGVLMETSAEIQRLRSAGAFADLARFIPFTVAEPSKAGRSSIMRDRAGFPVPFPRSEGVRTYNALLGDNHSYMELYWPDSTIEAGMKWHTQVAATMFLLAAEGAAETGLTGLREGGIDEVTVQRVLQPIIDVERSPLIAPFLEQPPPKRIAAAATPEAWMKVHPMLGKMLDDVYGTTFLRVPAVADPLLVDEDGNLPQLTPDQITEIKRLQEQYPDIGVLKNQRYYLPGGVWATAFENSPLGELNALLLRWEEEPLESQGRQTIQGKILIWSRKYAGVDVTLTAPSQAAKREEPRKKTETAGTKTF